MLDQLAVSPCSNPELGLDEALSAYAGLGYRKFEIFTGWVKSAFDYRGDPDFYVGKGREHGIGFSSMHLPPVGDDLDVTEAVAAARFAAAVGAPVVLFKASSRPNYIGSAGAFLDATEDLPITPVLQNHAGQPISTLEDFAEVLDGIADERMKCLLEVGQFHSEGIHWRDGYGLLAGRIALIHIKDQVGRQSVPFGTGEIDLPGLFRHMHAQAYAGDYVVEMEVQDRENTLRYLAEARDYAAEHWPGN